MATPFRVRSARARVVGRAERVLACIVVGIGPLLSACSGSDAPPLEALELRDALTAEPEVIASMPEASRKALAERFEEGRAEGGSGDRLGIDTVATTAGEVRAADAARQAKGQDALVTASLTPAEGGFTLKPLSIAGGSGPVAPLPPLEGPAPGDTVSLEEAALIGPAAPVLARALAASGAHRLVRVTGWPTAVLAEGDVLYVNASWLVALGSLEGGAGQQKPNIPLGPTLQPMALRGNSYLTYGTLSACVADVTKRCTDCLSSGACDTAPTLSDFSDARSECTFLGTDMKKAQELCAAALLSIDTIASCVAASAPACPAVGVVTTHDQLAFADTFLASKDCLNALDVCLSGGPPDSSGGTTNLINVDTSHCSDPFTACASGFKSLGDACKSGSCSNNSNQSCTSCSKSGSSSSCGSCNTCKSGSSSSPSSGSSSCGSKSCNKCEVAPEPPAPLGDAAWLMAPLGYLFLRARRRS